MIDLSKSWNPIIDKYSPEERKRKGLKQKQVTYTEEELAFLRGHEKASYSKMAENFRKKFGNTRTKGSLIRKCNDLFGPSAYRTRDFYNI